MDRELVNLQDLKLPACAVPRPGDRVIWYQNTMQFRGRLIGHRHNGRPIVQYDLGGASDLPSFECIRPEDPFSSVGPNWTNLPPEAKVVRPLPQELSKFDELLNQPMPPGPKYIELVQEIWSRGFEVYLVGGTVRDVLASQSSKDIDFVTTMPLARAFPLIKSMYRKPDALDPQAGFNGHIRLGGTPFSGDPFTDLCVFKHLLPGSPKAIFGSDFVLDTSHRDFACNSVYYEPMNKILIDPIGEGINDAIAKRLRIVVNLGMRTPYQIGQVVIRFFKFSARGFGADETCCTVMREQLIPYLAAMTITQRIRYIRTQVLSKYAKLEHETKLNEFRAKFIEFGAINIWNELIEPSREEILA